MVAWPTTTPSPHVRLQRLPLALLVRLMILTPAAGMAVAAVDGPPGAGERRGEAEADVHFVLAAHRCGEHERQMTSWVRDSRHSYTVYCEDPGTPTEGTVMVEKERAGRECGTVALPLLVAHEFHAYLDFIIRFYDRLPPKLALLHGHHDSWHSRGNAVRRLHSSWSTARDALYASFGNDGHYNMAVSSEADWTSVRACLLQLSTPLAAGQAPAVACRGSPPHPDLTFEQWHSPSKAKHALCEAPGSPWRMLTFMRRNHTDFVLELKAPGGVPMPPYHLTKCCGQYLVDRELLLWRPRAYFEGLLDRCRRLRDALALTPPEPQTGTPVEGHVGRVLEDAFFTALTGEWDEPAYEQSERNHRGYQPDAASAHVPVLFCPLPGASIPSHLQLSPGATEHVDSPHP
uniref:Uncharacterized protein n=1 Tax=Chlamydomonas euryale TaxID=1486919 RepID=A0A7R9Z776_9CHLO|mmetsp:Transcript_7221/g.21975  ORF Transcript_7221/g.21975 Transcript_7221/m.21975 type:complete len:403 (+) Transcript_7221:472-1680(+)